MPISRSGTHLAIDTIMQTKKGDKLVVRLSTLSSKTKVVTVHAVSPDSVTLMDCLSGLAVVSHAYLAKVLVGRAS